MALVAIRRVMKPAVARWHASTLLITMNVHYIYWLARRVAVRTILTDRDGSSDDTLMIARAFTDAETTGAPLVPMIADPAVAPDGGQPEAEYLEAAIWSHRRVE